MSYSLSWLLLWMLPASSDVYKVFQQIDHRERIQVLHLCFANSEFYMASYLQLLMGPFLLPSDSLGQAHAGRTILQPLPSQREKGRGEPHLCVYCLGHSAR